jgi:DNA-binding NarL/FixJ family response regulator
MAKERFERHKQPWTAEEAGKLKLLASKGQGLKQIAKALNRSEESTKTFARQQKIKVAKKR